MGLFSRSAQAPTPETSPEARAAPPAVPRTPSEHEPPTRLPWSEPRKPLVMFFAGAAFLLLSTTLTKKAIMRRWTASKPKYYQPNMQPNKVKGIIEAVEALQIATLNVMSGAIMFTGGALWALQISNKEILRARLGVFKASVGLDTSGGQSNENES
ncbi:hypothetical protein EJ05DRAFT_386422 [Pseudovirgaria hyperparasitica]|uniref:Altered inheritance of mitochondria protein 11 n=1 Tax=Pseudovirgaria hyperparasitica TaxID=470096 RepID=A0A6A6W5U6_9PEZI|nr:uncharacterized protein EJ05DRAFT_386422 [Pseudovirgaria hyperparasitica]KAF2757320.1 hypothetical protein EJ05DRAFT_386422 [Pseudovirgaria hyperparasitica]